MNYWILNPNNLNILTILFPIKLLTDLSLPFQFLFTSKKKKERESEKKRKERGERFRLLAQDQPNVFIVNSILCPKKCFFFFLSLYFFFLYNWLTISPNPFTWLYPTKQIQNPKSSLLKQVRNLESPFSLFICKLKINLRINKWKF